MKPEELGAWQALLQEELVLDIRADSVIIFKLPKTAGDISS